jgi:hypothetical protein
MNKRLIVSIVLTTLGVIGSGLFAIANSLNIIAAEISKDPVNITCGVILFILLGVSIAGFIMLIRELTRKTEK